MTAKNAILLIINQSPGIEYNALLSKITPQYGSVNSARAALSRAIKDMNAIGLIKRKENRFFATDKGEIQIHSEMKNKLLLKLNQTIQSKNSFQNIDSIVEHLAILIEQGKADASLLKAAKGATRFSIEDLRTINNQLKKRIHQMHYLEEIFEKQIETLQQLDFLDSVFLSFNPSTIEKIKKFFQKTGSQEFVIDSNQKEFIEKLGVSLNEKIKAGTLIIPKEKTNTLFSQLLQENQINTTIQTSSFSLQINSGQCILSGPHSQLTEFKKTIDTISLDR